MEGLGLVFLGEIRKEERVERKLGVFCGCCGGGGGFGQSREEGSERDGHISHCAKFHNLNYGPST